MKTPVERSKLEPTAPNSPVHSNDSPIYTTIDDIKDSIMKLKSEKYKNEISNPFTKIRSVTQAKSNFETAKRKWKKRNLDYEKIRRNSKNSKTPKRHKWNCESENQKSNNETDLISKSKTGNSKKEKNLESTRHVRNTEPITQKPSVETIKHKPKSDKCSTDVNGKIDVETAKSAFEDKSTNESKSTSYLCDVDIANNNNIKTVENSPDRTETSEERVSRYLDSHSDESKTSTSSSFHTQNVVITNDVCGTVFEKKIIPEHLIEAVQVNETDAGKVHVNKAETDVPHIVEADNDTVNVEEPDADTVQDNEVVTNAVHDMEPETNAFYIKETETDILHVNGHETDDTHVKKIDTDAGPIHVDKTDACVIGISETATGDVCVNDGDTGNVNANEANTDAVCINEMESEPVNVNEAETDSVNFEKSDTDAVRIKESENDTIHVNKIDTDDVHVDNADPAAVLIKGGETDTVGVNKADSDVAHDIEFVGDETSTVDDYDNSKQADDYENNPPNITYVDNSQLPSPIFDFYPIIDNDSRDGFKSEGTNSNNLTTEYNPDNNECPHNSIIDDSMELPDDENTVERIPERANTAEHGITEDHIRNSFVESTAVANSTESGNIDYHKNVEDSVLNSCMNEDTDTINDSTQLPINGNTVEDENITNPLLESSSPKENSKNPKTLLNPKCSIKIIKLSKAIEAVYSNNAKDGTEQEMLSPTDSEESLSNNSHVETGIVNIPLKEFIDSNCSFTFFCMFFFQC